MAKQNSLKEAHEQGYLELSKWADIMIHRLKMNYDIQRIWPLGKRGGGPYENYHIVNAARRGKYRSTGKSFDSIRKEVHDGAGGNTVAVDFFFRYYLYFVDWGVGKGQKFPEVPNHGKPKMKDNYADWRFTGDRQRRPVVIGTFKGCRFFLGNILQDFWGKEAEIAILYGLGYDNEKGEFVEFSGVK